MSRHDETFQLAVSNLLDWYDAATPEQVTRGRKWYDVATSYCRSVADECWILTYEQVAAVMAITSADCQLLHNVNYTRKACRNAGATAGKYPQDQLPKVRAALSDRENPGQYATGPKVSEFYRALIGCEDALVVDRWAAFAAGQRKDRAPAPGLARALREAYRMASLLVGEKARDFQAIVWTVCRDSGERQFADIAQVIA